ncbi:DUF1622 domain-containing protein [Mesorhizobium sp. B2-1-3A]|nr:DUF1622 domain-containing protein [Mesorhizobium sp. B2-1-3A]
MIEEWLRTLTELFVPLIDLLALIIIATGTIQAFINSIRVALSHPENDRAARSVWMHYSRWLIAGLTFQLAADIIETSTTPSWDDIGRIGAIAVIRTFLNFFLERDQREIRELQNDPEHPKAA